MDKVLSRGTKSLPLLLVAAVIGYYFSFLYQHALNVPLGDDIYDVLKVLSSALEADDAGAAFDSLYAQHNDHRTLTSRLAYLCTYLVTGEINFRTLTYLANFGLVLLLALLYLAMPDKPLRSLALVPAALLLFNLRAYGITLWSMAAFAYFYVFLYGFASLHCLHKATRGSFIAAAVLATLATFTLASGQVTWVVGLLSLLHQIYVRRTLPARYALCWLAIAAMVLTVWRIGLETPNTLWNMLAQLFLTPEHHILYTLALLGNAVSENSVGYATLAGATMLSVLLTYSIRSRAEADIRLELYGWFIVMSVAAMVLGRAPYSTVDYALSSRYSVPSVLMLATTWALLVVRSGLLSRRLLLAGILVSGFYCVSSYKIHARALQPYVEKRVENFNSGKYWAWTRSMQETSGLVARAVSLGIYNPPPRPLPAPTIYESP